MVDTEDRRTETVGCVFSNYNSQWKHSVFREVQPEVKKLTCLTEWIRHIAYHDTANGKRHAGKRHVYRHAHVAVFLSPFCFHRWNMVNELCIWQNFCGDAFRVFHYPSLYISILWETITESHTWHLRTNQDKYFPLKGVKAHYCLLSNSYHILTQHCLGTTFLKRLFPRLLDFFIKLLHVNSSSNNNNHKNT